MDIDIESLLHTKKAVKTKSPVGISLHPFLKIKSINLSSQSGEKQRCEESYLLSVSLQIIQFSSDSAD